jgi:hypothetical protein
VLAVFFVVCGGFLDGFKDIPWFSYKYLYKCRAIFVVAGYIGLLNGESCGDAVFLVACYDIDVFYFFGW